MLVEVNELVKRYGDVLALDYLSFHVEEGEILGLLGPNGSGKTTAIHCLMALLTYDKGTIRIQGQVMHPEAYDLKRNIGIVMQDIAVFWELTVYENIDYFCGLYISDKQKRKGYVEDAIAFVGLTAYQHTYPKKLSGGLLRRLNIACGIAHKPKLIILDEPTVAVDPQSRKNILDGIKRLNKEGATIIYTSHYMEEIEHLCDRIIIMDQGRVVAKGTKEALKEMISLGETIRVEGIILSEAQAACMKQLPCVELLTYKGEQLVIRYHHKQQNLMTLMHYFSEQQISFGDVYMMLPTLNDVFLEITGKDLRN